VSSEVVAYVVGGRGTGASGGARQVPVEGSAGRGDPAPVSVCRVSLCVTRSERMANQPTSRRNFLKAVSLTGGAAAVMALLPITGSYAHDETPTVYPTKTPYSTKTPTNTSYPTKTPTNTPVPPTATPTNTPVPPTATPTDTPVPPTMTPTSTPTPADLEGCTPGYWKQPQHLDAWGPTGYSPSQTLESVFDVPDAFGLDSATLLQALDFRGGSTLTGAARILLRQAVAALLNAAHPDVDFGLAPAEVIEQVNAALASGDRETILALAEELDVLNNEGCPLN
jgi:hypothetical protein